MNELSTQETGGDLSSFLPASSSPALMIMLNDKMFDRAKMIAGYLSKAEGFVPRHLVGKSEACFAIVTRAITWKLDPYAVAQSTYQTPGGVIGYEGRLCQAILENSGQVEGGVQFKHFGDWTKVQAKFAMKTGSSGKQFPAPAWKAEDEDGLGVIVSAQIAGEAEPRKLEFLLKQAFPRNSTLWATDPMTQICYTAVRRFASVATPHLFMGIPFDREDMSYVGPDNARDITPDRPKRSDYEGDEKVEAKADKAEPENAPEPEQDVEHLFDLYDEVGEIVTFGDAAQENIGPGIFVTEYCRCLSDLTTSDDVETFIENNESSVQEIVENALVDDGAAILAEAQQKARDSVAPDEGTDEAEEAASEPETGDEDKPSAWAVHYPSGAKRASQFTTYISECRKMLDTCKTGADFNAFLEANGAQMEEAAKKHNLSQLGEMLNEARANAE